VSSLVTISDDLCRAVAERVSRLVLESLPQSTDWLTVAGAAAYLATTEDAIRGHVKRGQIRVTVALLVESSSTARSLTHGSGVTSRLDADNGADLRWARQRNAPAARERPGAGTGGTSSHASSA
jgi:hypothetical protein